MTRNTYEFAAVTEGIQDRFAVVVEADSVDAAHDAAEREAKAVADDVYGLPLSEFYLETVTVRTEVRRC